MGDFSKSFAFLEYLNFTHKKTYAIVGFIIMRLNLFCQEIPDMTSQKEQSLKILKLCKAKI